MRPRIISKPTPLAAFASLPSCFPRPVGQIVAIAQVSCHSKRNDLPLRDADCRASCNTSRLGVVDRRSGLEHGLLSGRSPTCNPCRTP
jgi:hypothetical protein